MAKRHALLTKTVIVCRFLLHQIRSFNVILPVSTFIFAGILISNINRGIQWSDLHLNNFFHAVLGLVCIFALSIFSPLLLKRFLTPSIEPNFKNKLPQNTYMNFLSVNVLPCITKFFILSFSATAATSLMHFISSSSIWNLSFRNSHCQ